MLLDGHWTSESQGEGHVVFNAEGIHCGNCARSIRRSLSELAGVHRVEVNVVNNRVSVDWDTSKLALGKILGQVSALGFKPVPLVGEAAARSQQAERRLALKRIGLAALGSMQLMMYTVALYAGALQGIDEGIAEYLRWTCLVITTPVLFYSGAPILRGALADLRRRVLGMDVTVSLALLLAFFASTWNTVRNAGEVYFDSVAMFILLLLVGRFVEMRGRHQAARVTDALAKALPATAQRIRTDNEVVERVPLAELRVGDLLRVNTGQVIPVDGTLTSDGALIDESLLSGESLPQRRVQHDAIPGGAVNAGHALKLRVSRLPGDSTLHELVRLLERAQSERPRLGLAAERMASWFVIRILVLTAIVGVSWQFFDPTRAFPAMLAVLVATCPCALSLATPAAIAAASARLAKLGVLVMRADAVEGLATVDTVMLDKTGTLTHGTPVLTDLVNLGELTDDEVLRITASIEALSEHPVAHAIVTAYSGPLDTVEGFEAITGRGVRASIAGTVYTLGNHRLAEETGMCSPELEAILERLENEAKTAIVLMNAAPIAVLAVADTLRPNSRQAVDDLKALGVTTIMLTGDNQRTATAIALQAGIDDARGDLLPDDKLRIITELVATAGPVGMVGDGVNDAPALAKANLGIAMGAAGTDTAIETADIALMDDDPRKIAETIRISAHTAHVLWQNISIALGVKVIFLVLTLAGTASLWIAVLADMGASLVVIANGLRLLRRPAHGTRANARRDTPTTVTGR